MELYYHNDDNGIGGVHREVAVHRDHEAPFLPHLQDQVLALVGVAVVDVDTAVDVVVVMSQITNITRLLFYHTFTSMYLLLL